MLCPLGCKRLVLCALTVSIAFLATCKKDSNNGAGNADTDGAKSNAVPNASNPKDAKAPADVAAPPKDALQTDQGTFYKVLKPGDGAQPTANDRVEVHYTGWTTDGKMFDSSRQRGQPTKFGLGQVIAGWTDGLQTMKVGGQSRFWIPEALAYQGKPGRPAGMLVFDVELLSIIPAPKTPENVAAAPADAIKTANGIAQVILTPGTGKTKPRRWDKVKVHYSAWQTDGKLVDSSVLRERPATFVLSKVPGGWADALTTMVVGQKSRVWIPEALAKTDRPGAPTGMIVVDFQLLEITEMDKPPEAPKDVKAPPANAKKTKSGLAYRILSPVKQGDKPSATDTVSVHYSGWTTDGNMFDSSVQRGKPAEFGLDGVIAGWTEGLQLMKVGEKARFWIPETLAYQGQPGKPAGMLVFDVELLKIIK